jgi:nucleoside-diphosphate-sugar epimerase
MILLIGGSGFVGTRLFDVLKDKPCRIVDKVISHFYPESTILGDVCIQKDMNDVMKGVDTVVLLAAEHKDDVTPTSLYYDVNVQGARNVLAAMDEAGVKNILFFSSVAVYGLNKHNPNEDHQADPFNHYGKSKWEAEQELRSWYEKEPDKRTLTIIRPTVIFGERNRGNVYNLLSQIASKHFIMVGKGTNMKSMAYVGNVVAFVKFCLEHHLEGYHVYNYVDKPDFTMNELMRQVESSLEKSKSKLRFPYWIGFMGGLCFDLFAKLTSKKQVISAVRVKKFCATTQFDATATHQSGFVPPYTLSEGLHNTLYYEFLDPKKDTVEFLTE